MAENIADRWICETCTAVVVSDAPDAWAPYIGDFDLMDQIEATLRSWAPTRRVDFDQVMTLGGVTGKPSCDLCDEEVDRVFGVVGIEHKDRMHLEFNYGDRATVAIARGVLEDALPRACGWVQHKGYDSYVDRLLNGTSPGKHDKALRKVTMLDDVDYTVVS